MGRSKQLYVALEKLPKHIQVAFEEKGLKSIEELSEALSLGNSRSKHQELEMLLRYRAGAFTRGNKSGSKLARKVANLFDRPPEQLFAEGLFPQIPYPEPLSVSYVPFDTPTARPTLELWHLLITLAGTILSEEERRVFIRYFSMSVDRQDDDRNTRHLIRSNPEQFALLLEAERKIKARCA